MYGKGRVNGDLFQQFYCQFLPRGLLQGEIISEGKKAPSALTGRHLTGSVGWWLCFSCVQFQFAQVRLISGVFTVTGNPECVTIPEQCLLVFSKQFCQFDNISSASIFHHLHYCPQSKNWNRQQMYCTVLWKLRMRKELPHICLWKCF